MGMGIGSTSASPALDSRLLGIFSSRSHDPHTKPTVQIHPSHPYMYLSLSPAHFRTKIGKKLSQLKLLTKMFQHSVILPEMPPPDLILFSLSTAAVSLCTCFAVVTAAIGLWRIRAVGSKSDASHPISTAPPLKPNPPVGPTELTPQTAASCHVEPAGSPKARFTVCYSAEVEEEDDDAECGEEGGGESHREVTGTWELELEGSVAINRRRRGDLGWYRYQDRTAINGSVVRLWG